MAQLVATARAEGDSSLAPADSSQESLQKRVEDLERMVQWQGSWIQKLLRGSLVVVDGNGLSMFSSIQDAIDRCCFGDTVVVRKGVYRESVMLCKDGVTVQAADGDDVILENTADAAAVVIKGRSSFCGIRVVQLCKFFPAVRVDPPEGTKDSTGSPQLHCNGSAAAEDSRNASSRVAAKAVEPAAVGPALLQD
eukprot:RCo035681